MKQTDKFKKFFSSLFLLITLSFTFIACEKDTPELSDSLIIFTFNDAHGELDNFAKILSIIEAEKEENDVLVLCGGDMFTGNPVVDNHAEKGFPMIDMLNRMGVDAAVLGNHEFDYGEEVLAKRMEQSDFPWICANINADHSIIPEVDQYTIIEKGDLRIAVIGFIETNGKPNVSIPSTHPWRIQDLLFYSALNVANQFENTKEDENADLLIGLNHLGHYQDFNLVRQHPYFDLIIGGHSHAVVDTQINGAYIYQAGSHLKYLGKVSLQLKEKEIIESSFDLIDLNSVQDYDQEVFATIENYNQNSGLDEEIGFSAIYHQNSYNVGCFYTDALRLEMGVDFSIQNGGGIRNDLNEGPISKREIYAISPFNNGTVRYELSIFELKYLFKYIDIGLYYSGLNISQVGSEIIISNMEGEIQGDHVMISLGVNDYIPAVYDNLFPQERIIQDKTAAETIISYLMHHSEAIEYNDCDRYFDFQ